MAYFRSLWRAARRQADREPAQPTDGGNPIVMLQSSSSAPGSPEEFLLRLLVIEDDEQLGPWLKSELAGALGGADLVTTLDEALAAISVRQFDLIVVDRRLPDGDGVELLARLKQLQPRPGVLVLTALDDPNDIARALDAGADDYLAKPFEPIELIARAKAVIRRLQLDQRGRVTVANLMFDSTSRMAYVDGEPLLIPRRELALLEALARRSGQVVLRDTLEAAAYSFDDEIQSNAIDAHISRLRKRLRDNGCLASIKPLRGLGYLLCDTR
ncbi:two-component system OmpR family response regulator [Bradyrhizobium huanghuaihaiense]|uniref:DNA-binding response OmpR family regulator n=1 Tax=Bradyrhizobium huanghuaihaiense TaxID=990078 RepID=A0A562RUV4_9BRAD|nr:DNA-binding response OmpR family regulator [Bradyrhizobium huanghuaihaiense]